MLQSNTILSSIKALVRQNEPTAKIILYGSFAKGSNKPYSDIDLLILIDKETITSAEQKKIKYPLYDLEFETGQIISPLIFSTKEWYTKHAVTPLFENIKEEGIEL